ncbi:MAG: hypothetical protein D6820_07915, partial [Lentisphaerae bacterium]
MRLHWLEHTLIDESLRTAWDRDLPGKLILSEKELEALTLPETAYAKGNDELAAYNREIGNYSAARALEQNEIRGFVITGQQAGLFTG